MTRRLVFSLASVPDVEGLRRLHGLPAELSDSEVAEFAWQRRRAAGWSEMMPPHQRRVVMITAFLREAGRLELVTLKGDEAGLLRGFWQLLANVDRGVEWPAFDDGTSSREVLNCRSMLLRQVSAPDVPIDCLAALLAGPSAPYLPLHELAIMAGLPELDEASPGIVWREFQAGRLSNVEASCEVRALATYLLWLRYRCMRGELDAAGHLTELELLRLHLQEAGSPHLQAYLAAVSAGA